MPGEQTLPDPGDAPARAAARPAAAPEASAPGSRDGLACVAGFQQDALELATRMICLGEVHDQSNRCTVCSRARIGVGEVDTPEQE